MTFSVIEDDSLVWSKELTLVEPHEQLCGDDVIVGAATGIGIESICTELLDLTSIHPLYFLPSPLICMHFMSR